MGHWGPGALIDINYCLKEIYDDQKNLLIDAKSSWILTSLNTKKPARIDRHLPFLLTDPQMKIENDLTTLEPLTLADFNRTFQIRMHDLDFNRHVNNSVYPVWAMESVPADILYTYAPQEITINYIGESLYGDRIFSTVQKLDSNPAKAFLHSLTSENTQKEITRIKTVWKRSDEA